MKIDLNIIEKVRKISNIDFTSILGEISFFLDNDYIVLSNYFLGKSTLDSPVTFQKYSNLYKEFSSLHTKIYNFRNQLYNIEFVDFLEKLEIINDKLIYINNLNRWLRSSILNFTYYNQLQVDYLLQQGDTLERISRNLLQRQDFLDNWYDLALSNSLTEDKYTSEGGVPIKVPIERRVYSYSLNSVVDVISGKSCYGKDLPTRLTLYEEDLVVLDYFDTIKQSTEILVTLRKGDNLENRNLGLQEEVYVGSNRIYFNTPILIRQLSESFLTDDTLLDFQINEIRVDQDNFFIDFQVRTILGELLNLTSKF